MKNKHSGLTVAVEFSTYKSHDIANLLKQWKINPPPFESCDCTLFASAVIIPAQQQLPDTLMFFTSYCGSRKKHLETITSQCFLELKKLFETCKNVSIADEKALKKFIQRHSCSHIFYTGIDGLTKDLIIENQAMRDKADKYLLDNRPDLCSKKPKEIFKTVRQHILIKSPGISPNRQDNHGALDFLLFVLTYASLCIASSFYSSLVLYILLFPIVPIIIGLPVLILLAERQPDKLATRPDNERAKQVAATQCNEFINEMTAAGPLKKGISRRIIFWLVIKIVPHFSKLFGTIPNVVTARWASINAGRRMVFISNYTGMTEFYIRDFIDSKGSAKFINLLFGHGSGFPATKLLMRKGCLDNPQGFMNVVAQNQHPTNFWYRRFPYSVDRIIKNNTLRQRIHRSRSRENEIVEWLASI